MSLVFEFSWLEGWVHQFNSVWSRVFHQRFLISAAPPQFSPLLALLAPASPLLLFPPFALLLFPPALLSRAHRRQTSLMIQLPRSHSRWGHCAPLRSHYRLSSAVYFHRFNSLSFHQFISVRFHRIFHQLNSVNFHQFNSVWSHQVFHRFNLSVSFHQVFHHYPFHQPPPEPPTSLPSY